VPGHLRGHGDRDEQAIRRLTVPSFWSTVFGRYVKTAAHDARVRRTRGPEGQAARQSASRNCAACGRAYRPELATAREYCQAERPTLWGRWRLANVTVVDE
jgi:hypothetical protein